MTTTEQTPRHQVEPFQGGYVVIFIDAFGRRWQEHLGLLTKTEAEDLMKKVQA